MKLNLKKFDIKSIKSDKVCVFIGKRETGKSFLVKDMLYHHRNLPIGTVISGTEGANKFYGHMIPEMFIHEEYTPQIVNNVMTRQKKVVKKWTKELEIYNKSSINPWAFLILDDCLYDNSWLRDKNIRSFFMNGRHYKTLFIITMQYALGITPNLRTNIDYVFILRENYVSNRKRLYENYAGMFPSFEIFCQVMDQCTEDYHCLVINNNAKSNKLEDQVFWYKASPHEDFKLCERKFWLYQAQNKKDTDSEDEDAYDPSMHQRRGPTIRVNKTS